MDPIRVTVFVCALLQYNLNLYYAVDELIRPTIYTLMTKVYIYIYIYALVLDQKLHTKDNYLYPAACKLHT